MGRVLNKNEAMKKLKAGKPLLVYVGGSGFVGRREVARIEFDTVRIDTARKWIRQGLLKEDKRSSGRYFLNIRACRR